MVLCNAVHVEYFDGVPGHLFTQFGPRHSLRICWRGPQVVFYHNSDPNMFLEYVDGLPESSFYYKSEPDMLDMFGLSTQQFMALSSAIHVRSVNTKQTMVMCCALHVWLVDAKT